jgi:hypothetical protein
MIVPERNQDHFKMELFLSPATYKCSYYNSFNYLLKLPYLCSLYILKYNEKNYFVTILLVLPSDTSEESQTPMQSYLSHMSYFSYRSSCLIDLKCLTCLAFLTCLTHLSYFSHMSYFSYLSYFQISQRSVRDQFNLTYLTFLSCLNCSLLSHTSSLNFTCPTYLI